MYYKYFFLIFFKASVFFGRCPNSGEEDKTSDRCQWSCIQGSQCSKSQDPPSHGDPQLPPDCPNPHPGGKAVKEMTV